MSTPLPASHVANKAAAAARSSFPKKWTNLQDWFDDYSRFLRKQEQPPHLALADSDVVEALEKRFRTSIKELDDMRAVSGFYQAFANLSESDHCFSSTKAIEFALGVQAYFDGSADRDLYLKGTPIVQSSGTGKTCMVLELANYAPLLYICLRAQGSTLLQGFPQSEVKPVSYFVNSLKKQMLNNKGKPSGIPMYCCDLQVAAFLGAWFQQLVKQLAPLPNTKDKHNHLLRFIRYGTRNSTQVSDPTTRDPTPQASHATIDNVAQTKQLRDKFFSNVCEAANTLLDTAPTPDDLHNCAIFQYCLEPHISLLADQLGTVRDYLCLQ
ncbi:uncharacterized protein UTRI_06742 [Ustilago trichophora]|uniref:Uncharacterized protein n=1 Tax=Ustilago trichophora TaxID=86804 RepID=A0A5C3EP84_9BASI|nr:uncharacterized protein UTRI_06742 [Ustilago trichophora]